MAGGMTVTTTATATETEAEASSAVAVSVSAEVEVAVEVAVAVAVAVAVEVAAEAETEVVAQTIELDTGLAKAEAGVALTTGLGSTVLESRVERGRQSVAVARRTRRRLRRTGMAGRGQILVDLEAGHPLPVAAITLGGPLYEGEVAALPLDRALDRALEHALDHALLVELARLRSPGAG